MFFMNPNHKGEYNEAHQNEVDGRPQFYAFPYVSLRGIKRVGMVEAKLRWNFQPRWAVLGFASKGKVYGNDLAFETQDDIVAAGVGGR